ncbi:MULTISPECIES: hypothetical protein [Methanosarcina]|uniref:Uncharacterized protein n=1 Tax=Methanosarcina mazei Tuc01 TaxID=1236903 RepID=M1PWG6_METMZ|nr:MULTISPECIES: hypothetical protein [Methanosarcina]AGF96581.1 hypothetical protein MmTuc01_1194 [Methanosarcina mazei Tuc01]MDO5840563.1 hypothetical protein [Methanosarcina mazei]MDY0247788.1 hypothetical protein [Methanosarcina mazei]WIM44375.1 hypothetical protein PSF70_06100 [Methanosarcina mazei]WIM47832.1 hypothetical protein PQQ20_06075 [Methanosarcina mazei]
MKLLAVEFWMSFKEVPEIWTEGDLISRHLVFGKTSFTYIK